MATTISTASRSLRQSPSSLPHQTPPNPRYSLGQRCRSLITTSGTASPNEFAGRADHETPIDRLSGLKSWQADRINILQVRYGVRFESHSGQRTALANYAYLDLLARAWSAVERGPRQGGTVTDVGCANFWYACTLHTFFRPARLTGVDLEGFHLYPSGYSPYDTAAGYVADLPHTAFMVADDGEVNEPVDVITAWFPFVTPAPVLAWRLPLTLLRPERLLAGIARNLTAGGTFFMVNQGSYEAAIAAEYCRQAGFHSQGQWIHWRPLRDRPHPPVASWWSH